MGRTWVLYATHMDVLHKLGISIGKLFVRSQVLKEFLKKGTSSKGCYVYYISITKFQ